MEAIRRLTDSDYYLLDGRGRWESSLPRAAREELAVLLVEIDDALMD